MTGRVAALTGATGFLGRALCEVLPLEGWTLRVLARPDVEAPRGAEVVIGRLADQGALERLADDADLVVHVAGLVKARTPAGFIPVNVDGARRMAEAAAKTAPGAHFVLVSSLSARAPQLSAYAASKAAGEAAVREVVTPDRLTIVRPPAIYGPGDRETLALFRAVDRLPALPSPGPASARLALIHVEDAARQIAALAGQRPTGATWALADARPEGYGWREIVDEVARAVGKRPWIAPTPKAAILAPAPLAGRSSLRGAPRGPCRAS